MARRPTAGGRTASRPRLTPLPACLSSPLPAAPQVQTSAAAFTKGLLDLEGTSLTPILVSLVNKDASMLDAFGKGASEDIR
jgi:hypothetical protein